LGFELVVSDVLKYRLVIQTSLSNWCFSMAKKHLWGGQTPTRSMARVTSRREWPKSCWWLIVRWLSHNWRLL